MLHYAESIGRSHNKNKVSQHLECEKKEKHAQKHPKTGLDSNLPLDCIEEGMYNTL